MNKLKLRLDDIQVTGFELPAPETAGGGTVKGAEAISRYTLCNQKTCLGICEQDTWLC